MAVHGLNPLDKRCHAEATWTVGDKMWLRDFLPERIPEARILLFGYNSNVAFQTASSGVREQAENLLNQLEKVRVVCMPRLHRFPYAYHSLQEEPDRSLIFICHSLGGILVKRVSGQAKYWPAQNPDSILKTFLARHWSTPRVTKRMRTSGRPHLALPSLAPRIRGVTMPVWVT